MIFNLLHPWLYMFHWRVQPGESDRFWLDMIALWVVTSIVAIKFNKQAEIYDVSQLVSLYFWGYGVPTIIATLGVLSRKFNR